MISIGLIYSNPRVLKQVKKYTKENSTIAWNSVYTVNLVQSQDASVAIILGGVDMKKLQEFDVMEVFPVGWEEYWKNEERETAVIAEERLKYNNAKRWWKVW